MNIIPAIELCSKWVILTPGSRLRDTWICGGFDSKSPQWIGLRLLMTVPQSQPRIALGQVGAEPLGQLVGEEKSHVKP